MVPWRSPGDILRWWRSDVRGLTQQEAADRIGIQSSALSNWERATRAVSIDLDQLDAALDGGGALASLMWAQGTMDGLDPGREWSKVFPGESTPVWMWVRSEVERLELSGEWGLTRLDTTLELGPNGVFITVGASLPDSPVVVRLSEPAVADFGRGELPAVLPGASNLPAVSMFERSSADGSFMELFRSRWTGKVAARSRELAALASAAPRSVVSYLGARPSPPVPDPIEGPDTIDRERFARLRRARGLSQVEVAERLGETTGVAVSRDTLRRFEAGVGEPHHDLLPVALDHVLGAEGRLAAVETAHGQGDGAVAFPSFWRGPVWLELDNPSLTTVTLYRGQWARSHRSKGYQLVSAHWFEPAVPLIVRAEPAVRWRVGVGRRAGSKAIDQNWAPVSLEVAEKAAAEAEHTILTAFDRQPPEHGCGSTGDRSPGRGPS